MLVNRRNDTNASFGNGKRGGAAASTGPTESESQQQTRSGPTTTSPPTEATQLEENSDSQP
eukprot:14775855-Alexandrium_andersonii.AAC.1